jgi:hypothetical protein
MLRIISLTFIVALAAGLTGCGSTNAENEALLTQPLQGKNARIKIVRAQAFAAMAREARVKIDGRQVAEIGTGGSTVLDVAAGTHEVSVDVWDHPNVYTMKLDAKAGVLYTLEITTRDEAVAAGMFGVAGMMAEAAANPNGGLYQIRLVSEKNVSR